MSVFMIGTGHAASVDVRERFVLRPKTQEELYALLKQTDVRGTVLLSTCNRTEIYVSCAKDCVSSIYGALEYFFADFGRYRDFFWFRSDRDCFLHLTRVCCGAESQIFLEDQIITQVKDAIFRAREQKAADGVLEVFFRNAVACAKRIKTQIQTAPRGIGAAHCAADYLDRTDARSVLVIGNGKMGRLCAEQFISRGYRTAMTVRQYKIGEVKIPRGAEAFPFDRRYRRLHEFDAVVSATQSPHYTLKKEEIDVRLGCPRYYIDLAVPRDIPPSLSDLGTVVNIDELCGEARIEEMERVGKTIDSVCAAYYQKYCNWLSYKNSLRVKSEEIC